MYKNNIKAYRTIEVDDVSLAVLEMIRTVNAARNISTPNTEEVAAIAAAVNSLMAYLRIANNKPYFQGYSSIKNNSNYS